MKVVPAIQPLRAKRATLPAGAAKQFVEQLRIRDLAAELELNFRPRSEQTVIHLQSEAGEKFASISFLDKSDGRKLDVGDFAAPLPGTLGAPLQVHVFLDGSILEIFVDGTTALTKRIYTIPPRPLMLKLQGAMEIDSLNVWQMRPISNDRLTGSMCS
jgi:hypothetical protein